MLTLLLAVATCVLASARATRLVVADTWPPVYYLRQRYRQAVSYGQWEELVTCPFCFAPYAVAVDLAWMLWAGAPWLDLTAQPGWSWAAVWWVVNAWAALAYLASMVVVRDEPLDGEE